MLKRSGFRRPTLERVRTVHTPVPEHLRRGSMAPVIGIPTSAIEKENPLRSEAYRRLVAAMPCAHCGKGSRSQHAHENFMKGKCLKLDDRRGMPLCCDEPGLEGCHMKFDSYRLLPGGREAHIEQGRIWAAQTRAQIQAAGLWPANLPLWGGA